MVQITVDGRELEVKEGELLIEALLENGVAIPHFCYHPALGKDGNCRMCMVEIEGQKRPQIACDTPIKAGMVVRTKGEKIERVKRAILELELINHPIDCPICDQAGECSLQNYYMDVGLYESRLHTPKTHGRKHVDLGANVVLDQERCVLCTRCVRFTQKITQTHELGVLQRADHSVISTFPGTSLRPEYAMNVVDLCPVGALTSKDFRFHKRVWFLKTEEGICNHCARGCALYIDHHQEKYGVETIYRYRPRFHSQINGYFICDAGRLSYKEQNEALHVTPLIRGKQSEYSHTEAKLERLFKRHMQKVLILIDGSLSLEEMVRVQDMARYFGATLSGYGAKHIDETFGDRFLKCNDRSPNGRALGWLGIDESEEGFVKALDEAQWVLIIGDTPITCVREKGFEKGIAVMASTTPTTPEALEWFLPIPPHMGRQGSFITAQGYLQFHACEIAFKPEHKPLITLIEAVLHDGIQSLEMLWNERLVSTLACGVTSFEMLRTFGGKVEL